MGEVVKLSCTILNEGRRKGFFDKADLEQLFDAWAIEVLTETDMHRYGKPKICWELAACVRG